MRNPFRTWLPGLILWVTIVSVVVTPARAADITFHFQGQLVSGGTLPAGCGGAQASGTPFGGSLTYRTTSPDLHPAPQQAVHPGAVVGATLQLDGVVYGMTGTGSMQFQNGYNVTGHCGGALHDQLNFYFDVVSGSCAETFALSVTRVDCTGQMLATATQMPTEPPGAAYLPFGFEMAPMSGGAGLIGEIHTLSLEAPVPVVPQSWGVLKTRFGRSGSRD